MESQEREPRSDFAASIRNHAHIPPPHDPARHRLRSHAQGCRPAVAAVHAFGQRPGWLELNSVAVVNGRRYYCGMVRTVTIDQATRSVTVEVDERLLDFGYAPGQYSNVCVDCLKDHQWCDKRAWRCEPCAKRRLRERNEQATDVTPSEDKQ